MSRDLDLTGTVVDRGLYTPTLTPTNEQFGAFQGMFQYFNRELFEGTLPEVLLNFSRLRKAFGFFAPKRWSRGEVILHEISLNPELLKREAKEVASTLVHEQCHLWQQEYDKASKNGYHNKRWAVKMEAVGLIPSSTGAEGGKKVGHHVSHYISPGGRFDVLFAAMPPELALPWTGSAESVPVKNKPRTKYRCDVCEFTLQGKPGLDLSCRTCGNQLAIG